MFTPVLSLSVRLWNLSQNIRQRLIQGLVLVLTAFLAPMAQADDDIAGMVQKVLDGIKSVGPGLLDAAKVIGLVMVMTGLGLWFAKKNNPHIKGWHVIVCLVVGGLLIAVDQLTKKTEAQMDLNPVDVG
ncbi:hypothetical protein ELZ88_24775 (plasmid) [Salmonella enterica subsp. enterica serovar Karamoja]|uniref:Uncharacterized protein n=1 Tax=Salmonella enterica subsp. enterica serovar Karamoja TaxID=2500153 RepID=A0A3Q9MU96_SALET|nr:DUF6750 family protein [Salmonella enterica]AZT39735.1 hypothetical protein ELZ88_24775 [Salmonella enterica subsp. enterica serovar Karamoja]AZT44362.1 hypothetical protein EL007_24185 [Salmonella enterica subsp. enterica serovar Karamoja]